ncbi:MAG: hypothetical protein LQ346_003093 [Caloplaca aetnensis]|nr:MAG: hypothetical protein LQ346_003093 [Caloplaca aetnensis]
MAGCPTDETFEKALGALKILADVYTSLKPGEGIEIYKLVDRELNVILKAARNSSESSRFLDYLYRLAAVRTELDARMMTYDMKTMNELVMSLLSTLQAASQKDIKEEVSSANRISTTPVPLKRLLSTTEALGEAGLDKQTSVATESTIENVTKKQVLHWH